MWIWIVVAFVWGALGESGFIYWWTTDYTIEEAPRALLFVAPIAGPINWLAGYYIHGRKEE